MVLIIAPSSIRLNAFLAPSSLSRQAKITDESSKNITKLRVWLRLVVPLLTPPTKVFHQVLVYRVSYNLEAPSRPLEPLRQLEFCSLPTLLKRISVPAPYRLVVLT